MAVQVPVGMKVPFTVGNFADAAGNPTKVDNDATKPATLQVNSGSVEIVDAGPDGLSGAVKVNGVGMWQIAVIVDATQPGTADTKPLTILGDGEGISGDAVTGAVNFGAPVPA